MHAHGELVADPLGGADEPQRQVEVARGLDVAAEEGGGNPLRVVGTELVEARGLEQLVQTAFQRGAIGHGLMGMLGC